MQPLGANTRATWDNDGMLGILLPGAAFPAATAAAMQSSFGTTVNPDGHVLDPAFARMYKLDVVKKVGERVGERVGKRVGEGVGEGVGVRVGEHVGEGVGEGVGKGVGEFVVGKRVGKCVGKCVGAAVAKYNETRDASEKIETVPPVASSSSGSRACLAHLVWVKDELCDSIKSA